MNSEILFSIFKLLAGIGLFILATYLLEESLKNLAGRKFKLFIHRITKSTIGAVSGGALVTAFLQSSSMVSVLVLSFVGAGVLTMKNAMAVILGANLGTTIDSWLVATVGFTVNIEMITYPVVFIGGVLLIFFRKRSTIRYIAWFLFGFSLMFIALGFMKSAMEVQVNAFDFSAYSGMPSIIFLLIGLVITLITQSSSVTMAITLAALHTGVIEFLPAAAIVIGSETGTTFKILLSAVGGNASKKRVALGNFLFNAFLTVLAFSALKPIVLMITDVFKITDPLIGLVTFSTFINLVSIILFLPFLDRFTKFLERFYKRTDATVAAFLGHASADDPDSALTLFRKETAYFLHCSMIFNLELFDIDAQALKDNSDFKEIDEKKKFYSMPANEKYEFLKLLQGELQLFYLDLRIKINGEQADELNCLITTVRSSMHAAKSMKDVTTNMSNLRQSSKNIKFDFFVGHKNYTADLYARLNDLIRTVDIEKFEKLRTIYDEITKNYMLSLNSFYEKAHGSVLEDLDITTTMNFNRELFTSNKAILVAVKDLVLAPKDAAEFNEIFVYQT